MVATTRKPRTPLVKAATIADKPPKMNVTEESIPLINTELGIEDILPVGDPVMPKTRNTLLKTELTRLYGSAGMVLYPFDPICATAILSNAEKMAESMEELARKDPRVKRVLEKILETSAIGLVISAHAPVIATIVSHHVPVFRERLEKMVNNDINLDNMNEFTENETPVFTPPVYTPPPAPPSIYDETETVS